MAGKSQRRRQNAQRFMASLVEHLERAQPGDDVRAFLEAMQEWLLQNMRRFTEQDRDACGLQRYATMQLAQLPTMYAEFDPVFELSRMTEPPVDSIGQVASSIGRWFWEAITVWAEQDCPQCESGMRILQEQGNPLRLAYECDVCTWVEQEGRTAWPEGVRIEPATTEALRRRGLLLRSV